MKRLNIVLSIFTVLIFLVSCSSEIPGEYSGDTILGEIKVILKDDNTYEKILISNGTSPWNVTGDKGTETSSYGTWGVETSINGDNQIKRVWLMNYGKYTWYDLEEDLFGLEFILDHSTSLGSFD